MGSAIDPPSADSDAIRAMQARIADKMFGRRGDAKRFGRYVMLDPLGEGGLGSVYAAYDPELDRKVAIKIVRLGSAAPEGHRTRLLREAQALAKLSHPNVVQVFDVGAVDDQVFVAMELVRGQTLRDWLAHASLDYWFRDGSVRDAAGRRPLVRRTKIVPLTAPRPWREILDVFLQAGRGVAAAHASGLVHRDFKPENVMIDRDGRARVLDFGLARSVRTSEAYEEAESRAEVPALETPITRTGTVMGTPAYMAPEQHRGAKVDERSDQFGFCVALYESLYGKRPFRGSTRAEIAFAMAEGDMQPPGHDADVPAALLEILARGLAPDPKDRHPSMEELLVALQRFAGAPRRHSRAWKIGLASVLLLGLAAWPASALLRERTAPVAAPGEDECEDETLELETLDALAPRNTRITETILAPLRARLAVLESARREVCALSADLRTHRHACIRQRAHELHALAGAVDLTTVESFADVLAWLSDPAACLDRQERGRELQDRKTAALEAVDWAIAQAQRDAIRAREAARTAVQRARGSGDTVAEAEALVRLGRSRSDTGEHAEAVVADLAAAAALAEDADRPDLAAHAWLELARQAAHGSTGSAFKEVARTAVERAGRPRDLVRVLEELGGEKK